ncbi:MAG: Rieske 2Fe-2S domain-containing protein [Actinomycetota bacterium]|nr:Rieske 2Fe-2S domain-containing protein [Actinomycetota bacterium]
MTASDSDDRAGTAPAAPPGGPVRECTLQELQRSACRVLSAGGWTVAVFWHEGRPHALDNRCPHMGFPLHRGTVKDGILTCHWHHARFDLAGGSTLDPFADDVASFPVEVRDGVVWLDPSPRRPQPRGHWLRKLDEGLRHNLRLVLAKSVIGLLEPEAAGPAPAAAGGDASTDVLRAAALFGVANRADGWSSGLSILTSLANVLPALRPADVPLALYHGLVHVARSTAGQPPSFDLGTLATSEERPERYLQWFRRFVEVRAASAAERTLRTAIRVGLPPAAVADMVFAACTDHLFLDVGHALDFANKAFELLDHIGWEHAEQVLPALVGPLVTARRMEESASWRHPVDVVALLADACADLEALVDEGRKHPTAWDGHEQLADTILDAEPAETLATLRELVRTGVPLSELSATVAYAAARRPLHFSTANELSDRDTVHHCFTYANAVDRALRRAPSALVARGIFDGAVAVWLERFLNVPKRPIPRPSGRTPQPAQLLACFDAHGRVDDSAQVVTDALAAGRRDEIVATLGHALLREDSGFHAFQMYEAGLRQHRRFAGRPAGDHVLVGVARFLAAHAPTPRAAGQTFHIAARLHRGETLHAEA